MNKTFIFLPNNLENNFLISCAKFGVNHFGTIFLSPNKLIKDILYFDNYKVIDDEEIRIYDYLDNSAKVNKVLAENNVYVKSIYEAGISLEEYFENLVKDGVK